jgi:hypothetical protein
VAPFFLSFRIILMITWNRPSGLQITTNEEKATVEHCKKLGWKKAKAKAKATSPSDDLKPSDGGSEKKD